MAAPQPPVWNKNLPKYRLQDVDKAIRLNRLDSNPQMQAAINAAGGVDAYRNAIINYDKAYNDYVLAHAEYNYQQASQSPHANMSAYESQLASAYRKYAEKSDDPAVKEKYLGMADAREEAKQVAKAAEDREDYLRNAAMPVKDRLRTENLSIRDAEFDRLLQQRDSAYATVDADYKRDREILQRLKDAGMVTDSQYSTINDKIRSDWSNARNTIKESHIAGRAAATERYEQGKEFAGTTYNSILGGDYEEGREYALPTYDKELIQISSTYKPRFTSAIDNSKPTTVTQPTEQPKQDQPTSIQSETLQNVPNTVGGSNSSGKTPGSNALGGTTVVGQGGSTGNMLDASNLQQSPGLISGADRLTYTPAANLTVGGLITNQNPQLYNMGGPRVRLPGSV